MKALRAVYRHELRMIRQQFSGGPLTVLFWLALIGLVSLWLPLLIGTYWLQQPAFLIIYPLLASALCIQTIVDAVAGERERHTLESVLATPLREADFALGKILATVSCAAGLAVLCLALGIIALNLLHGGDGLLLPAPRDLLGVLALAVFCPLLISSAGFLASVAARSVRQGLQAYAASLLVLPIATAVGWLLLPERASQLAGRFLELPAAGRWLTTVAAVALPGLLLTLLSTRVMQRQRLFAGSPGVAARRQLGAVAAVMLLAAGWLLLTADPGAPPTPRSEATEERWRGTVLMDERELPLELYLDSDGRAHLGSEALGIDALASRPLERSADAISIDWPRRDTRFEGLEADNGDWVGLLSGPGGRRAVHFIRQGDAAPSAAATGHRERDLTVSSSAHGIRLGCTLTRPDSPLATVILVTGSGPQTRDHDVFGHLPYRDLAAYLAGRGIASLRCDDRGVGESGGQFDNATTADFADDVRGQLAFLHAESDRVPMGLLGHSEGGLVALEAADEAAFLLLLGTPATPGTQSLIARHRALLMRNGAAPDLLAAVAAADRKLYRLLSDAENEAAARLALKSLFETFREQDLPRRYRSTGLSYPYGEAALDRYLAKSLGWWRYALIQDPGPRLERLEVPVLVMIGGLDWQLSPLELEAYARRLPANPRSRLLLLAGHNHLFQRSETGNPEEYGLLEESISPTAMARIADWIIRVATAPEAR